MLVRVTLASGRAPDAKQAFYGLLAELLERRLQMRPENLSVILVENDRVDWSFGRGRASYVELPRDQWR